MALCVRELGGSGLQLLRHSSLGAHEIRGLGFGLGVMCLGVSVLL